MVRQFAPVVIGFVIASASTLTHAQAPAANAPQTPPARQAPIGPPPGDLTPRAGEHPLAPIIRWGKAGIAALEKLDGYTCKMVKRERIGGKLGDYQWLSVKVRQQPFSVYAAFTHNNKVRPWQEVVFVDGRHSGRMFVHSDEYRMMGTVSMFPDADRAMRDNRYPLTEMGILKLIERLVEHAESDARFDDCEVKVFQDAKIEDRPCHYISVKHKNPRPEFTFHIARIFIDNELNVPVRYEALTWPETPDGKPVLLEEYTYLDFKIKPDFTDRDFDFNNPDYFFPPDCGDPDVDFADVKPVAEWPAAKPAVPAQAGEPPTPLAGAIAVAREAATRLDAVRDYSCLLSHREPSAEQPQTYEHLLLKVRHDPAALYVFFVGPRTHKGQEAIYVPGRAGDMVLMHNVPARGQPTVTRRLAPDSAELQQSTGEPMGDVGIKAKLARWIAMWEAELPRGECTVQYYPHGEVDHRRATCIEVTHPQARPDFRFGQARLYIDEELNLPVRFEAYAFPKAAGQTPQLVEEFTYRDIQLNVGATDQDFDPSNPNYAFGQQATALRTTGQQ